jgi:ribose transport system substrate-binding protein
MPIKYFSLEEEIMKQLKTILFVTLTLLMAANLFGAAEKDKGGSGGSFDPSKVKVAFSNYILNHPTVRLFALGFMKAAQDLGYTQAKIVGTESDDASEALVAMQAFVAEGGKGIVTPWADNSGDAIFAAAARQGVIIASPHFNHAGPDGKWPEGIKFGMGCDPVKYGAECAEIMAKQLSGKSGSVAITQNNRNITENAASDSFIKTWNSLGSKYDIRNIKLLPIQLEGGVLDQATAVNLAIIQSNRDIIGAFGTTGNSPISWGDAAAKAGRQPGEICIIGMDATEGNLDYLEQGKVFAIAAQPLYEEHYMAMQYLDKVFRGETVPEWTHIDAPIVTRDGTGKNGPAYHRALAEEVKRFFK